MNLPPVFADPDRIRAERPPRPRPIKPPRQGLGCLPGAFAALLGIVLLLPVLDLACAPWIYRLGGRLRPLPVWAGSGVVVAPSGPYQIFVWLTPEPAKGQIVPFSGVLGQGYLCTPLGERYRLSLTGSAAGRPWGDMDGQPFHLAAVHQPSFWSTDKEPHLPSLSFSGNWARSTLVMTDDGSIANAFLPDARLNTVARATGRAKTRALPLTLTEAPWWSGPPACQRPPPAAQRPEPPKAHSAPKPRRAPAH
jgi:hypothetical protein